ncbi:MAG: lysine--tRNA ligase [Elusimicrobia bacterium]|nr:lysine--tRNA ligase [Elusimicrobiota bacterium]
MDARTPQADVAGDPRGDRLAKLGEIRARGIDPYPHRFTPTHSPSQVFPLGDGLAPEQRTEHTVTVAGRVVLLRVMGKAAFGHILDEGTKLQVYFKLDLLGDAYQIVKKELHLGDFIGVTGIVFKTKTGETTVEARSFTLLAKALLPLPDKWDGLKDTDTRYRQRHLDLIANEEVRRRFIARSRIVDAVRRTMNEAGFLEVETPILLGHAGGASATPFKTHHHALDADLVMRIALELPLKKLIIGGLPRVYELGRVFRNEGIDTKHNPEFTMLEAYQAYGDYNVMADLFESVLTGVAEELGLLGKTVRFADRDLKLVCDPETGKLKFRREYLPELWRKHLGEDIHLCLKGKGFDSAGLRALAERKGVPHGPDLPDAKVFDALFERYIEAHLPEPTFVLDHPTAITPLAKCKAGDESLVERFEFFFAGLEFANAYTELNDPVDQRGRFAEQAAQKAGGHGEAELLDEDFVSAMEHGMPPTGGIGIGIDRLTMLFTDTTTIREVILFPTLKP